jgi:hypothetical protein
MLTPGEPLTYLDRALAYVAPVWALRRARARRTLYLEQQRDLSAVRWIGGEPYTPTGDGEWLRVPGTERRALVPAPRWRASSFWQPVATAPPSRWAPAAPAPARPAGFTPRPRSPPMQRGGAGVAHAPALADDAVARTFGVELVLPHQLPLRRGGPTGPRALLCRLLYYALVEAELGPSARRPLRRRTPLAAGAGMCGPPNASSPGAGYVATSTTRSPSRSAGSATSSALTRRRSPQPCGARPADAPATRRRARRRGV